MVLFSLAGPMIGLELKSPGFKERVSMFMPLRFGRSGKAIEDLWRL